jgi:hypothetical protein
MCWPEKGVQQWWLPDDARCLVPDAVNVRYDCRLYILEPSTLRIKAQCCLARFECHNVQCSVLTFQVCGIIPKLPIHHPICIHLNPGIPFASHYVVHYPRNTEYYKKKRGKVYLKL